MDPEPSGDRFGVPQAQQLNRMERLVYFTEPTVWSPASKVVEEVGTDRHLFARCADSSDAEHVAEVGDGGLPFVDDLLARMAADGYDRHHGLQCESTERAWS